MTLDLDLNDLRIILAGLEQLPLGVAAPVYNKVGTQAQAQAAVSSRQSQDAPNTSPAAPPRSTCPP